MRVVCMVGSVLGAVCATVGCGSDSAAPRSREGGGTSGITGAGTGSGASGVGDAGGGGSAAGGVNGGGASGGLAGDGGTSSGGSGGSGLAGTGAGSGASLPVGNSGIAARYPGDAGIDADSAVVFADDFEGYARASDLAERWTYFYQAEYVGIAADPSEAYAGTQALEFTLPQQTSELSDGVDKDISPELDLLFLRYYSKIMAPYDVVGSSHNGSSISAHYFVPPNQATPGVPADGTNKFLVNLENWRGEAATPSPGYLNVYIYHPEQRSQWGDHFFPNGEVSPNTSLTYDFGPSFVSRDNLIPELDRWYCYELMVKANTPGQRDGRIAAWLDGVLVMDFMNVRLRDVASLTINRFGLSFHIGSNPNGVARKWYDNVVAATSYIGPLSP